MRRAAQLALVVFLMATPVWVLSQRPWDGRVSQERAAQLLEAKLANGIPYACSRVEQDGTVDDGYMDVDYFCQPVRRGDQIVETGYWFGTDSDRISTELIPSG